MVEVLKHRGDVALLQRLVEQSSEHWSQLVCTRPQGSRGHVVRALRFPGVLAPEMASDLPFPYDEWRSRWPWHSVRTPGEDWVAVGRGDQEAAADDEQQ